MARLQAGRTIRRTPPFHRTGVIIRPARSRALPMERTSNVERVSTTGLTCMGPPCAGHDPYIPPTIEMVISPTSRSLPLQREQR
jgi:hypothetical protein